MPKTIRTLLTWTILLCALAGAAWGQETDLAEVTEPWEPDQPGQAIDVAIALDVSGSMKPLADAARLKLWEIVQELTLYEPAPALRVALGGRPTRSGFMQ